MKRVDHRQRGWPLVCADLVFVRDGASPEPSVLVAGVLLPAALLGAIVHYPAYRLVDYIAKHASVKLLGASWDGKWTATE